MWCARASSARVRTRIATRPTWRLARRCYCPVCNRHNPPASPSPHPPPRVAPTPTSTRRCSTFDDDLDELRRLLCSPASAYALAYRDQRGKLVRFSYVGYAGSADIRELVAMLNTLHLGISDGAVDAIATALKRHIKRMTVAAVEDKDGKDAPRPDSIAGHTARYLKRCGVEFSADLYIMAWDKDGEPATEASGRQAECWTLNDRLRYPDMDNLVYSNSYAPMYKQYFTREELGGGGGLDSSALDDRSFYTADSDDESEDHDMSVNSDDSADDDDDDDDEDEALTRPPRRSERLAELRSRDPRNAALLAWLRAGARDKSVSRVVGCGIGRHDSAAVAPARACWVVWV